MEAQVFASHALPIALTALGGSIGLLAAIGGWCFKRIFEKLDALIVHKEGCITHFANRERNVQDHEKLFGYAHDHDRRIVQLESRVEHLEEGMRDAR